MGLQVHNYSRHSATELARVFDEISRHTSLVLALDYVKGVTGAMVIPTVITQDEYTHDVTLRVRDDLYLAYGMT